VSNTFENKEATINMGGEKLLNKIGENKSNCDQTTTTEPCLG